MFKHVFVCRNHQWCVSKHAWTVKQGNRQKAAKQRKFGCKTSETWWLKVKWVHKVNNVRMMLNMCLIWVLLPLKEDTLAKAKWVKEKLEKWRKNKWKRMNICRINIQTNKYTCFEILRVLKNKNKEIKLDEVEKRKNWLASSCGTGQDKWECLPY